MRASTAAAVAALAFIAATGPAHAAGVSVDVTGDRVVLRNALVQRSWDRAALRSTIVDRRGTDRVWSLDARDFTLELAGRQLGSELFHVASVEVAVLARGGRRVTMHLAGPVPTLTADRVAEAYPGIAGFRVQTIIRSAAPLLLSAATLDEADVGPQVTPTINAFRAGSDWREPGWTGPDYAIGDPHGGTWRDTRTAPAGAALSGPGEWISVADGDAGLFEVAERNDLPSSTVGYDGRTAAPRVDFTRDVVSLGPLEEQGHVENPVDGGPGRGRLVTAAGLALPAAFTGLARGDGDEAWQFHRYLVGHRLTPYDHDVVFNSDGTDQNRISTGAKDDMDEATVAQVAQTAARPRRRHLRPRRRLAGRVGRLAARLAPAPRAARDVRPALPRRRRSAASGS